MSSPVIIIHAAHFCGACKALTTGKRFADFVQLATSLNRDVQIKIIYHEDFTILNKKEEYPQLNKIPQFPLIMITTKDNCKKTGDMSKVKIHGFNWDGKKLVSKGTKSALDYDSFLRKNMW